MSKPIYAVVVGCVVILMVMCVDSSDPFGTNFAQRVVPFVILLNALQWMALPQKTALRLFGAVVAFAASLLFVAVAGALGLSYWAFAAIFVLLLAAHLGVLVRFSPDHSIRNVLYAESTAFAFIVLIGLYLYSHNVHFRSASDGKFLFWCPLAAMSFCISAALFGWTKWSRALFLIILVQITIGFLDVGIGQGILPITVLAILAFSTTLALTICWAEKLYPSARPSRSSR